MTEKEPLVELTINNTDVTLLGTAHVSQASADKVKELLQSKRFDAVAVELCPSRYNALVNPDALAQMDLFKVIREGKGAMVAASLALSAYQQRIAEQLDIKPGADMRAAVDVARDENIQVLLIDREIGTTLKRIKANIPWWRRMGLFAGLFASLLNREKITEQEIEQLKEGDVLESTFSQFSEQTPRIYKPLIDERDQYMAARIIEETQSSEQHQNILAVVGAGHLRGMKQYLQDASETTPPKETISALDQVPPVATWIKLLPWIIVAVILIGFAIGFQQSTDLGWQLVKEWVLINGGLSAIGAAIAGAHPLTVVTAFCAAPLTSLNPTIGAGVVTAAVEIILRKPNVGDFEHLRQDTTRLKGWWSNRVTRVLLIFILSSLGSAIGTYVAGFRIFEQISGA